MRAHFCLLLTALLTLSGKPALSQAVDNNKALKEGYGYLLLAIESLGTTPHKILLKGPKLFSSPSVQSTTPGDNYRLMPVPAGRYYFSQIYNDGKKEEAAYWDILNFDYYVDVEANTISYSGHFISEMYGEQEVDFIYRNRSSQAYEYLRHCCSETLRRYPLNFTGSYPDPFLDFLKNNNKAQKQ